MNVTDEGIQRRYGDRRRSCLVIFKQAKTSWPLNSVFLVSSLLNLVSYAVLWEENLLANSTELCCILVRNLLA